MCKCAYLQMFSWYFNKINKKVMTFDLTFVIKYLIISFHFTRQDWSKCLCASIFSRAMTLNWFPSQAERNGEKKSEYVVPTWHSFSRLHLISSKYFWNKLIMSWKIRDFRSNRILLNSYWKPIYATAFKEGWVHSEIYWN